MDYSSFDALMISGIIEKWILFVVVLLAIVIHEIYFIRHKFKSKKQEDESRGFGIFLLITAVAIFVIKLDATWFMVRDIKNHNYAEVHGAYIAEVPTQNDTYWWVLVVADDGEKISIKRPGNTHGEPQMFPIGTYEGTVWYAVESKCIVKFVPDEPIPEN